MTEKRSSIEQRIEVDRVEQLYKRSPNTTLAIFSASTIYLLFLSKIFPWQGLVYWYTVLLTVLLGRLLLYRYYLKSQNGKHSLEFWLNSFRFSIFAVGTTLGCLNLFFFPDHQSLTYIIFAIAYPFGFAAASLSILLDFFSFSIYAFTMLLPVVFQLGISGDQAYLGTSILTVTLLIFFLKFSKKYIENYYFTMRLRYENKNLVEELMVEKNKLNNRMARILNDSSSEIYVADASSLKCLQVNRGAIENLGYTEQEFFRINLLDIFVNLDQHSITELLAPITDNPRDIVMHHGYNRRKDGSTYPVEARFQMSTNDTPIVVVSVQDVSERKEWEEKLIYQANYDQLTGLLNRHYMQSYMPSVFARARRQRQKVALLFMDLDNFKDINDSLGHDAGDEILIQTSNRINDVLRETDTPARTGGDEFTVLIEQVKDSTDAKVVAEKLIEVFKRPFTYKEKEVYATASIGISVYPDDSTSHDQLMQYADIAMYQAKKDGKNNYRFFSFEMRRLSEEQMILANHLRYALANREFSLHYQPKIDITNGKIVGAEALLRWSNPEIGNVSPVTFVPLAEKMGLIQEIGRWVLEEACREAYIWLDLSNNGIHISVNVSPQQFRTGSLVDDVKSALISSGLKNELLELEITESLLLYDSKDQLDLLNTLSDMGISLALDDFGTGYSSLSYLKRFPVRVLKIDRSFIQDLVANGNSKALVEAIIAMAKSLKLEIVAEGVENVDQLAFLRHHDVLVAQGYFFSKPIPADKFRELLKQGPITSSN
jgi:diguanylate cyclase (GGDEF)-like protein/PAS domain S-box-containing protein